MTLIGIIGAGHIGSQLARAAISHGYDVVISNSRGPETLADLITELGPKATAATAAGAAAAGDFVVVTIPLKNLAEVPVAPLSGKVVIDTNNYYPERDGRIAGLDAEHATVSGMLQEHLPTSTVVKAFNNIMATDITDDATPSGTDNRRALPIAGDDADAKELLAKLVDEFGFDTVDAGSLAESWRFERDQPAYVVRQNAAELRVNLTKGARDKNGA